MRRSVEFEKGRGEGYGEITDRVGIGNGRQQRVQRSTGVLLAEWGRSTASRVERYRVRQSRTLKIVKHTDRSAERTSGPDAEKWASGWRSWVGNWSGDPTWGLTPAEATLRMVDSLDKLRETVPTRLSDRVAAVAKFPTLKDLGI